MEPDLKSLPSRACLSCLPVQNRLLRTCLPGPSSPAIPGPFEPLRSLSMTKVKQAGRGAATHGKCDFVDKFAGLVENIPKFVEKLVKTFNSLFSRPD
ncbi:hypothetical protein [Maricaulis maris]|uniref:hypothetical protein n=1 Tax=Maricaulis maris TaxID=74318 RepID=UPI00167F5260|nr:hypothetical protein [Maricaulis maris]